MVVNIQYKDAFVRMLGKSVKKDSNLDDAPVNTIQWAHTLPWSCTLPTR